MHEAAVVRQVAVATDKGVVRDARAECFDLQHVADDVLGFRVQVDMDERDVVVARDDIAQRIVALLDTLDLDAVWEGVAEVLDFGVRRDAWNEQPVLVSGGHAADEPCAADGGVHDWDVPREFLLEAGVKVLGRVDGDKAVGVRQSGEDTDVIGGFEADAESHWRLRANEK